MTRKNNTMSMNMFHKIVDEIASWNYPVEIVPTMYGEFFLNPNWFHILQYINTNAPLVKIAIPTNGSVLDNDKIDILFKIKNLKYIGFSVYAYYPETYQKLIGLPLDTIGKIENAVNRISKERPDIIINIGSSLDEKYISKDELEMFRKKWKSFATPHEITHNAQHTSDKVLSINKNYRCEIPCQTIFTSMVIQYNGDVCICCYDSQGELNIGNVNEQLNQFNHANLLNIWNGKRAIKYRDIHANGQRDSIPLCRSCDSNCWENQKR